MLKILGESLANNKGRIQSAGRARERYRAVESSGIDAAAPARVECLRIKDAVTTSDHGLAVRAVGKADARLECLIVHGLRVLLAEAGRTPVVPGDSQPARPVTRPRIRPEIEKRHIVAFLGGRRTDVPSPTRI